MNSFLFASLSEQMHALEARVISSLELVQEHFSHIQRINPRLNAFVQSAEERALAEARAADEARRQGVVKSPLHGIPFTVKDSLDTAGIVSTAGTLGRSGHVPARDASVVASLRQAGLILLGKTNCSELVMPFETDNLVYGRTNNPWHLEHTPGGSTGGGAALVAAGGSPLDVAGDAGGSIRVPAHFCGLVGIKPTTGRVPRTGHFPQMGGATGALAAIGPLVRSVQDARLVLPYVFHPDGIDPAYRSMPFDDPDDVQIAGLRVALFIDNEIMPADNETALAVESAARMLAEAGARVTRQRPPGMDSVIAIFYGLFGADGGTRVRAFLQRIGTQHISIPLQRLLDRLPGYALDTAEFMSLLGKLDGLRSKMLGFMQDFDVLLGPTTAHPAPLHDTLLDHDGALRLSYSILYSLLGWPAISVPVSQTQDGLPIGVQIAAQAWREDVVLAAARVIEEAGGGYRPPPLHDR